LEPWLSRCAPSRGAPRQMKPDTAALGIDTSCYTTSVALVSSGDSVYDGRAPLAVRQGELGLRQQDAVFQHIKALPGLIETAFEVARSRGLVVRSVAASAWPRRVEGSYMPVFSVSAGAGRATAAALGCAFVEVSHQEGHVAAALHGLERRLEGRHLALHISGGTTELLVVEDRYSITAIGGSSDLNAGQFIDRVGVALGLPFPAGPVMEELAATGVPGAVTLPASVRGTAVSFSGPCSAALRQLEAGARGEDVALAVFSCIGRALGRLAAGGMSSTGLNTLVVAGGVACNGVVKAVLTRELRRAVPSARVEFAQPHYARDNAVGVALLAYRELVEAEAAAEEARGGECGDR
jgi:N6-L-threonylcarbamoyladenine synthase